MSTKPEYLAIDRFEGGVAVLVSDDGDVIEVDRSLLPDASREGAVLSVARSDQGPQGGQM